MTLLDALFRPSRIYDRWDSAPTHLRKLVIMGTWVEGIAEGIAVSFPILLGLLIARWAGAQIDLFGVILGALVHLLTTILVGLPWGKRGAIISAITSVSAIPFGALVEIYPLPALFLSALCYGLALSSVSPPRTLPNLVTSSFYPLAAVGMYFVFPRPEWVLGSILGWLMGYLRLPIFVAENLLALLALIIENIAPHSFHFPSPYLYDELIVLPVLGLPRQTNSFVLSKTTRNPFTRWVAARLVAKHPESALEMVAELGARYNGEESHRFSLSVYLLAELAGLPSPQCDEWLAYILTTLVRSEAPSPYRDMYLAWYKLLTVAVAKNSSLADIADALEVAITSTRQVDGNLANVLSVFLETITTGTIPPQFPVPETTAQFPTLIFLAGKMFQAHALWKSGYSIAAAADIRQIRQLASHLLPRELAHLILIVLDIWEQRLYTGTEKSFVPLDA